MRRGEQEAWSLAALALVLQAESSPALLSAAEAVLAAHDLDAVADIAGLDRRLAGGQAAAPLLQTATLVSGDVSGWQDQSDEALLAQGRASGQAAAAFKAFMLPTMTGLAQALAQPGARMLDVGTGTGELAVAFAETFETLTVVGIDVLPRALSLAERTVSASTASQRVELRQQDLATLCDSAEYDLAWVPAPFCPEPALTAGIPALARALKPGGWLMLGHGKFHGDNLEDALTRLKTIVFGGTALDDVQAQRLLTAGGLIDVRTMQTPPGAPGITVARRSEH